jgi:hypothetical protein
MVSGSVLVVCVFFFIFEVWAHIFYFFGNLMLRAVVDGW